MRERRLGLAFVVMVLGLLSMAPTVGDVGGCGSEAELLGRTNFEAARKDQDCARCRACGLTTARCARACDPAAAPDVLIPITCRPLLHDGVVCIRALEAASCDAYAAYVDDEAPTLPSECVFCRGGQGSPGFTDDGGAP